MVKEGLGYALSFYKIVNTDSESDLCFVPLYPLLESYMYIIWKKYQVFTPIAEVLLNDMKTFFSKLDTDKY